MTRSASLLLVARLVSALTTLAVLAIVARTEGAEELGAVALGLTVSLVLALIPEAGLTALFTREIARQPERAPRMLGALLLLRAVALPVVTLIVWLLVAWAYPGHVTTIVIVAFGPAIQQVAELARAVFIARDRAAVAAAHWIVENLVWLGAVAFGTWTGAGLDRSFIYAAIALVVVDTGAFFLLDATLGVLPARPTRADIGGILRQAGPFTAFTTLTLVASRVDTLLVGLLLPNGLVTAGAYYAAVRLVAAGEYFPDAVSRAIYPELSRRYHTDPAGLRGLLSGAVRQLLAIAIPAPFGMALAGGWLMATLYGGGFADYDWILVAIAAVLPLRYISTLFGVTLTSSDSQGRRTRALAIGVTSGVVVDTLLLPRIGVGGAVIGTFVTWILLTALNVIEIRRDFGWVIEPGDIGRPLLVSLVAFAVGVAIRSTGIDAAEPIAGVVFVAIAAALPLAGAVRRLSGPAAI